MIEVTLRFVAKDEKTYKNIVDRFYKMCESTPKVCGWGLISKEEKE